MDNVEKLRVILQHWIDHNKGHVEEFETWRKTMADEDHESLSTYITEAIKAMATVNSQLGKALHEIGGPKAAGEGGHSHHHDRRDH